MFFKLTGLLTAALASLAMSLPAHAEIPIVDISSLQTSTMVEAATTGLKWNVGDKANYKMSGGIINGTIAALVREDTGTAFWVQQDANMGFLGKQKIEILFNKADGQILKLLVNGQEQQVPSAGDVEVIEMKEDRVRVTAGEFDCIYVKVKDKKQNQIQEAWVNPQAVPISGMIKSLSDTQFGKLTQELTSFSFGR